MLRLTVVLLSGFVSFLLAGAQAHAACGKVEVSKGDVKIQSGQTKKVESAPIGAKICSGDTIIAGKDSRAKLKMEDGNELNISPDSKIVLENYQFNAADNKKKVLLNILQGKVRAATQKENMYNDKATDGQANTFQVKTKSAVAGVRGTDFMTGFDPKTNKSEVVTFRGKVEFGQPGPGGQILNPVQVGAGQKTEAVAGQPPAPPKTVPPKELAAANTESKAETGGGGGSGSGSGGSSDKSDKKDGDKKDGDKKSDGSGDKKSEGDKKSASNGSDSKRDPANSDSGSSSGGSGSMLTKGDQGGEHQTDGNALGSGGPKPPAPPPAPPAPPELPKLPSAPPNIPPAPTPTKGKVNININYK
jgi:hypothetical protein